MKNELQELTYDREKAVAYAHRWAYYRNPGYYDFQDVGGDCTNFASQCIFAGCGIMNYTPTLGWYYIGVSDRAPAWTGVQYLYNFLTSNKDVGPYAHIAPLTEAQPGDVIQLALTRAEFQNSPMVVAVGMGVNGVPDADSITVAAHSLDCDCRPLSSYSYRDLRLLHVDGVRYCLQNET